MTRRTVTLAQLLHKGAQLAADHLAPPGTSVPLRKIVDLTFAANAKVRTPPAAPRPPAKAPDVAIRGVATQASEAPAVGTVEVFGADGKLVGRVR